MILRDFFLVGMAVATMFWLVSHMVCTPCRAENIQDILEQRPACSSNALHRCGFKSGVGIRI